MNLQKTFEKSENQAVLIFVGILIVAHFLVLWLIGIV